MQLELGIIKAEGCLGISFSAIHTLYSLCKRSLSELRKENITKEHH